MDSKKSMKSSMINSLGKDVYIDKKYAYKSYCNILADISKQVFGIDGFGVTKIEMILFSIADGDIVGEVLEATPWFFRFSRNQNLRWIIQVAQTKIRS